MLIIDFNKFSNNIFHVVDEHTISGSRFSRRPDVIIYINGLPVVVIELKNMTDEKATIETAYNQLETCSKMTHLNWTLFQWNKCN